MRRILAAALGLSAPLVIASACASSPAPIGNTSKQVMPIASADPAELTPRERAEWTKQLGELLAPCPDVPVPIQQCIDEKRPCAKCSVASKQVLLWVRDGLPAAEVDKRYHRRFDPGSAKQIPIDGSPSKGPESAPVTIIEFADFECKYCEAMFGRLNKAMEANPGRIRVVYKFYPLKIHAHAEMAAKAGIAAIKQGKFWEMHDKMYQNQDRLESSDLEGYAKALGMDVAKFNADRAAKEVDERLARDKDVADTLYVKSTPTVFINGRELDPRQDLQEWIGIELTEPTKPEALKADPKNKADAGAPKK